MAIDTFSFSLSTHTAILCPTTCGLNSSVLQIGPSPHMVWTGLKVQPGHNMQYIMALKCITTWNTSQRGVIHHDMECITTWNTPQHGIHHDIEYSIMNGANPWPRCTNCQHDVPEVIGDGNHGRMGGATSGQEQEITELRKQRPKTDCIFLQRVMI